MMMTMTAMMVMMMRIQRMLILAWIMIIEYVLINNERNKNIMSVRRRELSWSSSFENSSSVFELSYFDIFQRMNVCGSTTKSDLFLSPSSPKKYCLIREHALLIGPLCPVGLVAAVVCPLTGLFAGSVRFI